MNGNLEGYLALQGSIDYSGAIVQILELGTIAITDLAGKYIFRDVPVGTYHILAACRGWSNYTSSAFRIEAGETTTLNRISLTVPTGSLDGYVYLKDVSERDGRGGDHSGTRVIIIDTPQLILTDRNGHFSFPSVSQGIYQLTYEHDGYVPARSHVLTLKAGSLYNMSQTTLELPQHSEPETEPKPILKKPPLRKPPKKFMKRKS